MQPSPQSSHQHWRECSIEPVRRSLVVLLALLALPASAAAAPVVVLGHHGRVFHRSDPFLSGPSLTPAPALAAAPRSTPGSSARPGSGFSAALAPARRAQSRRRARRPQTTVRSELTRLLRQHAIAPATYAADNASFNSALAAERHLTGTRRAELTSVTQTLHQIAAARGFVPSRLPALFATLDRNRQWWTSGPLLASGQRVEFAGSQLVWEYYPGQGLQIQVLGNFGKVNGLYESGVANYGAMQQLLGELTPLAVRRGGGLAWEYYFHFDGGNPPWTSAMSQATGLQALSNAYLATHNQYYLQVAASALPLFSAPPPAGVQIRTSLGTRYLQYTFAPTVSIINAFLQTLVGLDTYAHVSGNQTAAQLFAAGNAEAVAEVPSFDTGAWSLYQPGLEDDLSYHELVTGFLVQLCTMTGTPVYCTTAQHFQAYLKIPPVLQQLTGTARKGHSITLGFQLSKASHVGVTITQGNTAKFLTSANFPYGRQSFTIPALRSPGTYGVRLAATDLAGNYAAVNGTLQVTR
jgi:hypothetical protein